MEMYFGLKNWKYRERIKFEEIKPIKQYEKTYTPDRYCAIVKCGSM
jgi:hypothetical protein